MGSKNLNFEMTARFTMTATETNPLMGTLIQSGAITTHITDIKANH